jgi:tRNA pseudouridine38-40 synthase
MSLHATYALLIEYDGTPFSGWQKQQNAVGVQDVVSNALSKAIGQDVVCVGSGRTDAGVHAVGQVAHVSCLQPLAIPLPKLPLVINNQLPPSVRIHQCVQTPLDFHARYDALIRQYVYRIGFQPSALNANRLWVQPPGLSVEKLREAARCFVGTHSFDAFSKHNESTHSYVCTVHSIDVTEYRQELRIRITANRFVYGMCRAIVAAMVSVANHQRSTQHLQQLLIAAERSHPVALAPSCGLYLTRVQYSVDYFADNSVLTMFD